MCPTRVRSQFLPLPKMPARRNFLFERSSGSVSTGDSQSEAPLVTQAAVGRLPGGHAAKATQNKRKDDLKHGMSVFFEKQDKSDSGVGEKNDAQQLSNRLSHGDSRALDFNVGWARGRTIYIKRHLFRHWGHSTSCPKAATLKSGAGGNVPA